MQIKSVFISNTTKLLGAWIYSLFMTSQTALQCKHSFESSLWCQTGIEPCFLWSKLVVVVIHKNPGLKQIKTKQWNFAQKNTNIYLREKYKYLFEGKIGGNSWWGEHILKQISTKWWSCPTSKFCTVNCHNWLNELIANL